MRVSLRNGWGCPGVEFAWYRKKDGPSSTKQGNGTGAHMAFFSHHHPPKILFSLRVRMHSHARTHTARTHTPISKKGLKQVTIKDVLFSSKNENHFMKWESKSRLRIAVVTEHRSQP